jgi:hypothetical protein
MSLDQCTRNSAAELGISDRDTKEIADRIERFGSKRQAQGRLDPAHYVDVHCALRYRRPARGTSVAGIEVAPEPQGLYDNGDRALPPAGGTSAV